VSAAPWSIAIIAGIFLVIGFGTAGLYFSGTISTLRERVSLYQDRLQGASPDQAKAKMDALEDKVRNTFGDKWQPLTVDESTKLVALVSPRAKRRIEIMYSNYLGEEFVRSIAAAFTSSTVWRRLWYWNIDGSGKWRGDCD
jgi:hypothetical protein